MCGKQKFFICKLSFSFANDKPIAVYAYCNLHGLWKTEIK